MCFEMKDIASGDSILFAPRLPAEYAVWLGEIKQLSHFKVIILWACSQIVKGWMYWG